MEIHTRLADAHLYFINKSALHVLSESGSAVIVFVSSVVSHTESVTLVTTVQWLLDLMMNVGLIF